MRYPCDHCEFAAVTAGHLKTHIESKHKGVRYPCDQCMYAATIKSDLKRHKKRKHNKISM